MSHTIEELDVVIMGAGISGIGAARYLTVERPGTRFAILEARHAIGGTWDLFKYPGLRSDSDLHTFGYVFKPWKDKDAIADAHKILAYLDETVEENRLRDRIRFHRKVVSADWQAAEARWLITVTDTESGAREQIAARWFFAAGGYYSYEGGFSPAFEGRERFAGRIVHPQEWPEDLDYAGKRVVVIGSGATAVTLIPAMAEQAGHITMLQRTPSYILPIPKQDPLANLLIKLLGEKRGFAISRARNIAQQRLLYEFCQRFPGPARRFIRGINAKFLGEDFPVDEHFNPPYDPWDQRLCIVPDGDLFKTLRSGQADIVTDRVRTFTETGVELESGRHLEADIVVTATGLNLLAFGGIELSLDGEPVELAELVAYKGAMLSGIPNFAFSVGYTNSSWTLKVGLVCDWFCRLLGFMEEHDYAVVTPELPAGMDTRPLLDFGAGYVQRSIDRFPRQGVQAPWRVAMSYYVDRKQLGAPIADPALHFEGAPATLGTSARVGVA